MIRGVIFDMDGLMFDTERIWDACWAPALAKFGLSYKEGLSQASRGTTRSGTCDVLRRFYGDGCPAAGIVEELYRLAYEAFTKPVPKMAGLDELLAWLDAHHIPMAVASSSPMTIIEGHLGHWQLSHYFKAVISCIRSFTSFMQSSSPASIWPARSLRRTSFFWPQKSWALPLPRHWCWRTATTASGPAQPGASSL